MKLFYITSIHWLSRGNVPSHVFEMKDKIKSFLEAKKEIFASYFGDELWTKSLAYLTDIFEKLNG